MKIKKSTVIITIFFIGISFLTILEAFRIKKHLSIAEYMTPFHPDTYLMVLGVVMAFFAILFLLKEVLFSSYQMIGGSGTKIRDIVMTMTIFIFYVGSMGWLGYTLSTFLFYFVFLRWIGKYYYAKTVILSIIITICYDLIFIKGFSMILPTGIIENLLF